jgi:hypothetical protein
MDETLSSDSGVEEGEVVSFTQFQEILNCEEDVLETLLESLKNTGYLYETDEGYAATDKIDSVSDEDFIVEMVEELPDGFAEEL